MMNTGVQSLRPLASLLFSKAPRVTRGGHCLILNSSSIHSQQSKGKVEESPLSFEAPFPLSKPGPVASSSLNSASLHVPRPAKGQGLFIISRFLPRKLYDYNKIPRRIVTTVALPLADAIFKALLCLVSNVNHSQIFTIKDNIYSFLKNHNRFKGAKNYSWHWLKQ